MNFKNRDKDGLFKSIFTAYFILLLHVFLLAGAGVTVVLFRGVYHYLPWIMAGLGILILAIAWIFYRRVRHSSTDIKAILSMPEYRDRTIEIRLFGGLASFKINAPENRADLIGHRPESPSSRLLIQENFHQTEQKILNLTALYEKDLITREEFERAKHTIIQG
jgi:hypothetical protein